MRRSLAMMSAVVAAIFLATPVWAESGPPAMGGGVGQVTSATVTPIGTADGNTFLEVHLTGLISGTFSGTFMETDREVVHADGTVNIEGRGVQSGIQGTCGAGSVNYRVDAQGTVASFDGKVRSTDTANNTVQIHTVQTFMTTGPTTFAYSAIYHCR